GGASAPMSRRTPSVATPVSGGSGGGGGGGACGGGARIDDGPVAVSACAWAGGGAPQVAAPRASGTSASPRRTRSSSALCSSRAAVSARANWAQARGTTSFTCRMESPGRSPARAAGDPGSTASTARTPARSARLKPVAERPSSQAPPPAAAPAHRAPAPVSQDQSPTPPAPPPVVGPADGAAALVPAFRRPPPLGVRQLRVDPAAYLVGGDVAARRDASNRGLGCDEDDPDLVEEAPPRLHQDRRLDHDGS